MSKTPEQVHLNMSHIHCKDTCIEVKLRKELWSRGIRYRKNVSGIIGKPDLAFIGKRIAVFCDSEFWHGYDWSNRKDDFKKNSEFWVAKIERNMARDCKVDLELRTQGWTVIRFWGKQIENDVSGCADTIEAALKKND